LHHATHDGGAGGVRQPRQLVQVLVHTDRVARTFARRADQEGTLNRRLDVDQRTNTTSLKQLP
jgi:hypothetical protein